MTIPQIALPQMPPALRFNVPNMAGGQFQALALGSGGLIEIFDVIGGAHVTASRIADALRQFRGQRVVMQINSPGGDYFEGISIFNLLRAHDQPVLVQVVGLAASAASIIAMAGARTEMARNAALVLHRASSLAVGDGDVMREAARVLDKLDDAMAATYGARSRQPKADMVQLMRAGDLLSSEQCVDLGLADALLEQDSVPFPETIESNELLVDTLPPDEDEPETLGEVEALRELERYFRRHGISRRESARLAAAAWPAIGKDGDALDSDLLAALIDRQTYDIHRMGGN